jgi:AcrR family transcriptional regulator
VQLLGNVPRVNGPHDPDARPPCRFSPRSAPTRKAILEAARRRFGADGYERTTVRAVAADAGVTAAMVIRYYGSKAALFAASTHAGFATLDVAGVAPDEIGRRFARAALEPWEAGTHPEMAAVHRAAATHADAAEAIQQLVDMQVIPALRAAFPDDPDIDTRAALVHSQGLGVIMGRYLLRLEPLASMDFETLVAAVGDAVQLHLTRPMRDAPDVSPSHPRR